MHPKESNEIMKGVNEKSKEQIRLLEEVTIL